MHNNNNRFIEGRNLHLDCSLLSIHARMSRNSRFDPLSREIKPPLPLLSITMRKSLGEKVAWRGGKRLKSDEKSSGPVFESRKSKKKKREREGQRHTVPVFSRHGWDPAIFARLRPVAMDHVGWYWITSNERVCPAQSSPRSSRTGSKLFSKPLPMLCQRTPLRWSCGNRW